MLSFADEYGVTPDEIWVTASSDKAIKLISDWQASGVHRLERVVLAADSLSLWTLSSEYPLSLWHEPDWAGCSSSAHIAIHRCTARAIEKMLTRLWPVLSPTLTDVMIHDLVNLLNPILLVANAVLMLRLPCSARVHLESGWPGTAWLTDFLHATGAPVSVWGSGHSKTAIAARSPSRLLGRSCASTIRYGPVPKLMRGSVLFLVTTPYYASKLAPTFLKALQDDGINGYFPAFGSSRNQKIARQLNMPPISAVDPFPVLQQYLLRQAAERTQPNEQLLESSLRTFAPKFIHYGAMLYAGVYSALTKLRPSAILGNFQGFLEGAALFRAAQELSIPTLLLQAGAFTNVEQYVRPQADYYVTRDLDSAQRLWASGVPTECVYPIGSVFRNQTDESLVLNHRSPPVVIGVCSGGFYGPSDPDHWRRAAEIIRSVPLAERVKITVRPHPSESGQGVHAMASAFLSEFEWTMDTSPDISTFLRSVDLVIHDTSTVGNDARELGTPEISSTLDKTWQIGQVIDQSQTISQPTEDTVVHKTITLLKQIIS